MNTSLFSLFPAAVLCLGRTMCCSDRLSGVSSNSSFFCQLPMQPQANLFASLEFVSEAAHLNWLLWDQKYQRFLNRGGKEVSSAFSLIHIKLPAALEGVEATEKVAAKPSF